MTKDYKEEIIENFSQYHIGLDDVFAFKCRGCGKCCRNRQDILLNSRDLYNIATALNMTHRQVIEKYCDVYIGRDSRIPVVRLQPKGPNMACPLLVGDKCSVHAVNPALKPTVCALYPLGRVMASEAAKEDMGLYAEFCRPNETQYILHPDRCGSLKREQTVRAWLERFGIPAEDDFFIRWNKTVFELITAVQKHEGKSYATPNALNMMWGGIFHALYINYDTQKEFFPQFADNVARIRRLFSEIGKYF